ncbi:hypothetical protein C8R47DRAFT_1091479 [Mycena vitilis]|nr:hypothetical protein C8R47DRAFT_1091479 [Mycena vitilis]
MHRHTRVTYSSLSKRAARAATRIDIRSSHGSSAPGGTSAHATYWGPQIEALCCSVCWLRYALFIRSCATLSSVAATALLSLARSKAHRKPNCSRDYGRMKAEMQMDAHDPPHCVTYAFCWRERRTGTRYSRTPDGDIPTPPPFLRLDGESRSSSRLCLQPPPALPRTAIARAAACVRCAILQALARQTNFDVRSRDRPVAAVAA